MRNRLIQTRPGSLFSVRTVLLSLAIFTGLFSLSGKKKQFVPPGTVQISEFFFADKTEITNLSWNEYLYWLGNVYGPSSPQYQSAWPDTNVWVKGSSYYQNELYRNLYLRHVAFNEYPVVGISYEQALDYCKWRTDRVKAFHSIRYKKELDITYRLPTKEEWEKLATINLPPMDIKRLSSLKKRPFNYILDTSANKDNVFKPYHNFEFTVPAKSNEPNLFGLYNVIGNVAEMIQEKNICKGGSFFHAPSDCRPGKNITYETPQAWLGFRCVCVLGR